MMKMMMTYNNQRINSIKSSRTTGRKRFIMIELVDLRVSSIRFLLSITTNFSVAAKLRGSIRSINTIFSSLILIFSGCYLLPLLEHFGIFRYF